MNSKANDHNSQGRFLPNNTVSSKGGKARAAALPAHRRSEIARAGYRAMVQKHFNGDYARAKQWLVKRGLATQDPFPQNGAFPDPGPHPARRRS